MTISLQSLFNDTLPNNYRDKVFWYASKLTIDDEKNCVDIYIDSQNCLVAFDDIAKELKLKPISEISKSATNEVGNYPVLISSGSFLWINDQLVVTQRTADTKFDPLHWTTPAGRCDATPLNTAYKETAEEIHGFSQLTGELWMPEPTIQYLSSQTLKEQKVHAYPVDTHFPANLPIKTSTIRTWVDGELIETAEMWFYYSQAVNTLELRLPLYAEIKEKLYFENAEFDTQATMMNINELQEKDIVPAVDKLIKEINNEKHTKRC